MESSYCELSFNWTPDKPYTCVTTYSFIDRTANDEYENNSIICHTEISIQLVNNNSGNCTLHLTCPNPEFACVNGLLLVSESKTLEISNDTYGYIATIHGKPLEASQDSKVQDVDSIPSLYSCRCLFEEDYSSLTVKFLSLGERSSFCIKSIVINVCQCTDNKVSPMRGTFNISKLKKNIAEMGETMSDRAKDFLLTMEQFEENKLNNFQGLIMGAQSLSHQHPLSSSTGSLSPFIDSLLGGMLSLPNTCSPCEDSNGDNPDMYKMLQAVCGSVTNMRKAAKEQSKAVASIASPDSGVDSVSHFPHKDNEREFNHLDILTNLIEQKIIQAKSDLQTEFTDFKQEMMCKFDEVTSAMNKKLDTIIDMLNDMQRVKGVNGETLTNVQ